MNHRLHRLALFVLLFPVLPASLALTTAVATAEDGGPPFTAEALPPGWSIQREIVVPAEQLPTFSERLGGEIVDLRNQFLSVNGFPAQVNVIVGKSDAEAKKLEAKLVALRSAAFVRRDGRRVYEVAGDSMLLAARVHAALGLPARSATYDVAFRVALVDRCDYTTWNRVFNLFLRRQRRADDSNIQAEIRELTKSWTFGDTLALRRSTPAFFVTDWSFEPEPTHSVEDGALVRHTFADAPKILGIPYVEVRGTAIVRERFEPTTDPYAAAKTDPTPLWPPAIEGAGAIGAEAEDPRRRVLQVLAWLQEHVSYGGEVGSRDPVGEVVRRGYGRCWDKSDVLVTLCRSLGIPAREVAGWLPPLRSGHIWTEVRLGNDGWIPVDATTTWLGTGADYVPFFVSEDGEMPFLYLTLPEVVRR